MGFVFWTGPPALEETEAFTQWGLFSTSALALEHTDALAKWGLFSGLVLLLLRKRRR